MEKEINFEIKKLEIIVLLIFLGVILFLELQVSMKSNISFGDEGFHTRMAQWIAEEKEYPVWRPFEGSNLERIAFERPPLWNLLEASFLYIFGFHESIIKFLTPFISVLSSVALFVLVKKLYNEKVALIAAIIFVTVPSFVTYSVLFYTDILYTFYFMLFILTFILAFKSGEKKYLILASIFGAFSFLTKTTGIVAYLFIALVFLYQLIKERKFAILFKKYLLLVLISILIISPFFLRGYYYYKTPACNLPWLPFFKTEGCAIDKFEDKYQFAGRTEQVGTEISPTRMGIANYLNFAYGNIWFVIFGFVCGLLLFFLRRSDIDTLILIALTTIFILVQSTQRAEDLARFTLGWVPIVALIAASYFEGIYNYIKKYQKHLALIVFIIVIILGYQNLTGKLNTMSQVKRFSPAFFEACKWIKENTPEDSSIFTVWSHRAVYSCQRNSVGNFADISLSKDLNYTLSVARQHGITHLFIQKFSIDPGNSHLSEKYDLEFVQFLENNPDYFKKIYENGPPLQQCLQQGGCDGNIAYEINFTTS